MSSQSRAVATRTLRVRVRSAHVDHSVSARGPAPPLRAGMLRELAPGYRAVVGLTGSIASGKSHAREHLARLQRQVEARQHGRLGARGVPERHVAQLELSHKDARARGGPEGGRRRGG